MAPHVLPGSSMTVDRGFVQCGRLVKRHGLLGEGIPPIIRLVLGGADRMIARDASDTIGTTTNMSRQTIEENVCSAIKIERTEISIEEIGINSTADYS